MGSRLRGNARVMRATDGRNKNINKIKYLHIFHRVVGMTQRTLKCIVKQYARSVSGLSKAAWCNSVAQLVRYNPRTTQPQGARHVRHPSALENIATKSSTTGPSCPMGWSFKDVGAVAVDSKDQVYVFNRGEHPMMVFDRDGNFLRSWGEGQYPRAHCLHIDADDTLYLTDDGGHVVRKCTTMGKILMEIGTPGKPTPYMSGLPFHRCTHTALSPKGEIYVSDGYGNAKVHKYSPDGKTADVVGRARH